MKKYATPVLQEHAFLTDSTLQVELVSTNANLEVGPGTTDQGGFVNKAPMKW